MLFKIESKTPLTNCKNESLNQIIGGIVKLAGQFYLTDVGEVNYLYSTLIEQSNGNQKQIEKLEKAKEKNCLKYELMVVVYYRLAIIAILEIILRT